MKYKLIVRRIENLNCELIIMIKHKKLQRFKVVFILEHVPIKVLSCLGNFGSNFIKAQLNIITTSRKYFLDHLIIR